MFTQLFTIAIKNRSKIIFVFKLWYLFLVTLFFIGAWSIYNTDDNFIFFYNLARNLGQTALLVYVLTTIPGITKRFKIQHRLIQLIMLFRRYFGITVFLLAFTHFMWLRGISLLQKGIFSSQLATFELMGASALFLLFWMFLTSNDQSTKFLGPWWKRLHRVTYIIVWFIFLHVALQSKAPWMWIIGIDAVAQVASHIYNFLQQKPKPEPPVFSSG